MPCVFLKNVPEKFFEERSISFGKTIDVLDTQELFGDIAKAARCQVTDVEIYFSDEKYKTLSIDNFVLDCPNIHGFVVWFGSEKRDVKVKHAIANALQRYLDRYGFGKGFNLTFMDMPAGSFFFEKGLKAVVVEGGENQIEALKKEISSVRSTVHGQMDF